MFAPSYPADEANQYTKHILFGNADKGQYNNPYADMLKGYKDTQTSQMAAQFELKQNLDFITEGLSLLVLCLIQIDMVILMYLVNMYRSSIE